MYSVLLELLEIEALFFNCLLFKALFCSGMN